MGIIYKITNKVNGKSYIGKTVKSINRRFYEHCHNAELGVQTVFYDAIRKYGKENFNISIIEEIDNDLLNDRESYWINYYHTYLKDPLCRGYNSTLGGDGGDTRSKKLLLYEDNVLKLWNQGLSIKQITDQIDLDKRSVSKILLRNGYTTKDIQVRKGQCWNQTMISRTSKPIEQYDKNGNFIHKFPSVSEAGRVMKCSPSAISNCAKGKSKTSMGYIWKFSNN